MSRRKTPHLRRRRFKRGPKRLFVIFCEGEKTEPAYIGALRQLYSNALIKIETVNGAGVPYTVATLAADRAQSSGLSGARRKNLDSFEENDQVWAVFDRDEHPRFNEAVAKCEKFGVGVARSNPCFEVWLILHEEEFDKPDGRRAVQDHLKKLRPEFSRRGAKTPDCDDLVSRVNVAERRASTLLTRREKEGKPFGPPSSTVGHLTVAIRKAARET